MYCRPKIKHNRYEKNCSIFIVDDEIDTLESLRIILEGNNFKVEAFTDPAIALDRYVPRSYDLLIIDIKLIGTDLIYIKILKGRIPIYHVFSHCSF